jgi:hypothetical protein
MNRSLGYFVAIMALPASTAPAAIPQTQQAFERAKLVCRAGAADLVDTREGPAIILKGVTRDDSARQRQIKCLTDHMRGTEVRFLGFITDPDAERPK